VKVSLKKKISTMRHCKHGKTNTQKQEEKKRFKVK